MQKGAITPHTDPYEIGTPWTALWASVMVQGIIDMDSSDKHERKRAYDWFWADEMQPGAFLWICEMLDLDANRLQFMCMSREGRARLLARSWWTA